MSDDMTYGVEGPPNPANLTDHILLPEQGDKDPQHGLSVFYGIVHETEDLPDHKAFADAIPDTTSDIHEGVVQSARQGLTPAVQHAPSNLVITRSVHIGVADPMMQLLGADPQRRRATVSIVPDDFSAVGALAYVSDRELGSPGPFGALVCCSAVPDTLIREFTADDDVWVVLDPTSKPCWVSLHIERY